MSNPITPPPELVQQWEEDWHHSKVKHIELEPYIAAQAAQWGADQEILACGNYLKQCAQWEEEDVTEFYNYRRPKPPSLKEQALMALEDGDTGPGASLTSNEVDIIRRALEQLDALGI
jgi:hypothetical protein